MIGTSISLYIQCSRLATTQLARSWLILPASGAALGAYILAQYLFGGLGMVGSLLVGIVSLLLLTLYYGWIRAAADRERVSRESLLHFDGALFNDILNVAFFLFPASLSISLLAQRPESQGLAACGSLALLILCNPIPEMIHRARVSGLEAIVESFKFVQQNWLVWFLPVVILASPLIFVDLATVLMILSSSDQFIPMHRLLTGVGLEITGHQGLGLLVAVIVCNWFMLFRAALFMELSNRSDRARRFRAQAGGA